LYSNIIFLSMPAKSETWLTDSKTMIILLNKSAIHNLPIFSLKRIIPDAKRQKNDHHPAPRKVQMKTVVKGGTLVMPSGIFRADLGIQDDKIAAISGSLPLEGARLVDASEAWIFPGGIDVHCHLPWPSKDILSGDDVTSGSRAAICGGVTTVIDFVIPELGETLTDAVERKITETDRGLYSDYCAHVCVREVSEENLAQIPALVQRGFISYKIFMAYQGFQLEDRDILRLMSAVKDAGGIVTVHAENGLLADRATRDQAANGHLALGYYPESRPVYCEEEAIQRILTYAAATRAPLHIHHVSSGAGARLIAKARRRGLDVTGETCPQYLMFNDQVYHAEGLPATYLVIAPPLRKPTDQEELWKALASGGLSMVATDHCPYTIAQKSAGIDNFTRVPGGTGGVETRWPVLFTESYVKGRLSLERLSAVWAANPARMFGLHPMKGSIAIGADADLIIVRPEAHTTLSIDHLHMNTDHTVYEGFQALGFPLTTLLRGQIVVQDGEPVGDPFGTLFTRSQNRFPVV
jgi:dihydropyrimidinase